MFRSRVIVTANIQSRRPRNVVKNPDKNVENTFEQDVNKQTDGVSDKIIEPEQVTNNDADKKSHTENDKDKSVQSDTVNNSDNNIIDSVSSDIPVPATEASVLPDAPVSDSKTSDAVVTDGNCTTDVSDAETASSEPKKNDSTVSSSPVKTLPRSCFMRPVPRLDGPGRVRRNSVQGSGASASESEDDSRRHLSVAINTNRTDNSDNQCSLSISFRNNTTNINNNSSSNNNNNNNSNTDNESTGARSIVKPKKKFVISESTRKLAEKRREFQLEYKNSKPDRSKLTMYDLIHYNPSTNPMKQLETVQKPISRPVVSEEEEEVVEEDADDPDEGGMPAPQVKVGPDGQLILDEQSLVIETTSAIKQRKAMANTDVVIDDNLYGSGFYKQRSRMKEWPKWETIAFYKALSTIGTDFSLMKSLFPKRNRSDLKRKFKKEERLNAKLVMKALSSDCDFDFDQLKNDLETFERMETSKKVPVNKAPHKEKKAKRRMAVTSLGLAALDNEEGKQDQNQNKKKKISASKPSKPEPLNKKKKKRARSISVHSEEDSAEVGSESDTEIYRPRPTRSGRVPRPKKFRGNSKHILDNILGGVTPTDEADTPNADSTASKILSLERDENSGADITNVEPGSLVIVSKESTDEPGKTEVQVYMVKSTDDAQNNLAKPDLATDIVSVTKNLIASHPDELDID